MNFVTLTIHSPSHAIATVNAKVKRNSRTAKSMGVGEVRGERKERTAGREEELALLKFNEWR